MNAMLTVARKELRALFRSPVAVLFLAVFLLVTLFTFFTWSLYWSRGLADVRPLFNWLPILLVFLVSAVTMRSWAEERRSGTLEVLLTLPVDVRDLVVGKFLAGLALVGVALALTLPIPFVVASLGPLDWGPVFGGYLGAALLGGAYLAIGQAISARTDNQVVALMTTLTVGGALVLIGSERMASFVSTDNAQWLSLLGTGSRFSSIERGVIDLRDIVYYVSIATVALAFNVATLQSGRIDAGSPAGSASRRQLAMTVGLITANAIAANVWLAPIGALRTDLTEHGEYSLGDATRRTLASLPEPLTITGYFSGRTHEMLAPLVPRIEDLLTEYQVAGGERVRVSFVDPGTDPAIEEEIGEQYAIRSFPFGVSDAHSQGVVNAYFHILIRTGDQFEVLDFEDLIEVRPEADGVKVELRNLEYDVTKTIRKVSQEFSGLDTILASLPSGSKLELFATPTRIPTDFAPALDAMRKVSGELATASQGRLTFTETDPSTDPALQQRLDEQFGVRPLAVDLFGRDVFYQHLVLTAGDTVERILPRADLADADVRTAIEAAAKRAVPGQLKTVALFTENPENPPPNPQIPPQFQPPQRQPDYQQLPAFLGETLSVRNETLAEGFVPEDVDVLVLGKTGPMTDEQRFAVDQFLLRGGSVVALAGAWRVAPDQGQLKAEKEDASLRNLLAGWGVDVADAIVMDPQNAPFPIPIMERRGGFQIQRIELLPYPPFPDIRGAGLHRDHPALGGVASLTAPWASPIDASRAASSGAVAQVIAETSRDAWRDTTGVITPDPIAHGKLGFAQGAERKSEVVAVTLSGRFASAFAGKPNPLFAGAGDGQGRALDKSIADGRLVVFGSSEMVSDIMVSIASGPSGEVHRGNLDLLLNAIDWSVEDTELLSIRSGGAYTRTLEPMEAADKQRIETLTAAAILLPMFLLVFFPLTRNWRVKPIPVEGAR